MTPFECYKSYLALKQHFTSSYDYHKYNGKTGASVKGFENRRDRYYFEKLSKKRDPFSFLLANIANDPSKWIGNIVMEDSSEAEYNKWVKRNQALTYTFREELSVLSEDFDSNFMCDGGHPPILQEYLRKKISIETLIILVQLTKCFSKWNKMMKYDPVWHSISTKMQKYQPFMKYDIDKFRKIVMEKFS